MEAGTFLAQYALAAPWQTVPVTEPPPDELLSPDGRTGWFAYHPSGSRGHSDDEAWQAPPEHSTIRLMGEDSVDVPLWDEEGLMFSNVDELQRELGVSAELADDLVSWGRAWQTRSGESNHDSEAAILVRRLNRELNYRYQFVYKP